MSSLPEKDEECAVPVVELSENEKGGYRLNLRELEAILLDKEIAGKQVAIISVAGAFRKGKSFLLNFFVHYLEWLESGKDGEWFDEETVLDKFHWRGGSKRDTHGIILWNKPYILQNKFGDDVVVLLMDTQGTFDHNSTVKECATIFAMSTLLSSVQIFNVSTQIQEDDLQNLRLFTEYAQLAQKDSKTAPFQKLLFVVRDWPNSDEHEYGYEGGADYVEDILKITTGQKKELQSLRKNLGSSFDQIQGFLMPHPGLRIARNNSEKLLGKVEEEFEEEIGVFVPSLFEASEIEAKRIAGCPITCAELFEFFKVYVEVFNSDSMPEPKSILEATAQAILISAEEEAKAEYFRLMKEVEDPKFVNERMLLNVHEIAKKCALKTFDCKPKLGDDELSEKYRNSLIKTVERRFGELKQQVEARRKAEEEKQRLAEEKKRMEEAKKRAEEERKKEEARQAAEKEKLRKEGEEQERKRREMEEEQRRREEELRRQEKERRRREEEFRLKEQQRQREEAATRERQRQEVERLRREQERLAEARRRMEREEEEQRLRMEREQEEARKRIQRENERIQAERASQLTRQLESNWMSSLMMSPASSGYGSACSSPASDRYGSSFNSPARDVYGSSFNSPARDGYGSSSNSPSSGLRYDSNVNRWRDESGRFAKSPYSEAASSSTTSYRASGPVFDERCNRWRAPNGRFCKNPYE